MATTLTRTVEALQPHMQKAVKALLNDLRYERIPVFICETLRPFKRQAELYAQGRTKPGPIVTHAKPGHSYHAFGLAIDVYPCDKDGDPIWDFDPEKSSWPRIVQLAKMRGLEWGGDWPSFKDYPHFQMAHAPRLILCRLRWPRGWQPPKGTLE